MKERQWRVCTKPDAMLDQLRGRVSERKLRLFAVACCRDIWDLLPDERSRAAVEVAEQYADGRADQRQRARARNAALGAADRRSHHAAWAAYWTASANLRDSLWNAREAAVEATARSAVHTARAAGTDPAAAWDAARAAGARRQAALVREVFGNPFRPARLVPLGRHGPGELVRSMAREMYEGRDFGDLPILADALEEMGAAGDDILGHCRSGAEHVRGCWVVDLLLGKT